MPGFVLQAHIQRHNGTVSAFDEYHCKLFSDKTHNNTIHNKKPAFFLTS